ncbi:hypothetical protein F2P79_008475 [Pimephales promelas]|nr:hypothetical protein F2P79_008475 [Pimephales promelas]
MAQRKWQKKMSAAEALEMIQADDEAPVLDQHLCRSYQDHAAPPDELLHFNHSHQAHPPPHLILMCLKKAFQKERGKHYRSLQDLSAVGVGLPLQETKSSRGTIERRRTTNLTRPDSC